MLAVIVLLAIASVHRSAQSVDPGPGLVVEEVERGWVAYHAGLARGDVLTGSFTTGFGAQEPLSENRLISPFDLQTVEREEPWQGDVWLRYTRGTQPAVVRLPPGRWGMRVRPRLSPSDTAAYEQGVRHVAAGRREIGLKLWGHLAESLRRRGDLDRAAWLYFETARVASTAPADPVRFDVAAAAARASGRAAGDGKRLASLEELLAFQLRMLRDWKGAVAALRAAAAADDPGDEGSVRQCWRLAHIGNLYGEYERSDTGQELLQQALANIGRIAPRSFERATALEALGRIAERRRDLRTAEDLFRQALAIREQIVPEGLELAQSFSDLGNVAWFKRDLTAADAYYRRALELDQRQQISGWDICADVANVGMMALVRGDLATAESYLRQAVAQAPDHSRMKDMYHNLGVVLVERGNLAEAEVNIRRALELHKPAADDMSSAVYWHSLAGVVALQGELDEAERHYRRALAIQESVVGKGLEIAITLSSLGELAEKRGRLADAAKLYEQALEMHRQVAPGTYHEAETRLMLGSIAIKSGNLRQARAFLEEALRIQQRAPNPLALAGTLRALGDASLADGDWDSGDRYFRRALALQQTAAPGTVDEAEIYHSLAVSSQRRGDGARTLSFALRALQSLDAQRGRLGGVKPLSNLTGTHKELYQQALDLLIGAGKDGEAFHVLERYRARGLLALLAERELSFSADIPPELDRERRMANVEYDRLQSELLNAAPAEAAETTEQLRRIRERQDGIRLRIREASPRLARLQYPAPLDLAGTRAALEPGTALLSYWIGDKTSYLFVVGPGPQDLAVHRLDTDASRLRADVTRLRDRLRGEDAETVRTAMQLGATLLAPASDAIARAERLLIVPDGALHLVPFGALVPGGDARFLIEKVPLHVAASATVFAEMKKRRREPRPERLVAFGDPDYSGVGHPATALASSSRGGERAAVRGLDLYPLPSTRREVQSLLDLFGGRARGYLGADATEERAKALSPDATLIHFACHGLANEEAPLESALALSIRRDGVPGRDNGLLQAWEILEQLRIDADLVTLSACNTALGKEMSGEGLLGLTQAFQYAGARSLLTSLWEINDLSTAELMTRFYGHLQAGESKDRALQRAQVEMIRRPAFAHPSRWAAFQLVGDWR